MSALPPPLPPATPIRKTVIPDPFSATSTLTPLSSMGESWTKSSSPSALSRPRTSSPEDGDGSPPPPRRISQRPKRSTRFDALLTPQKALPTRMKLVSDSEAATGKTGALERNTLRRKRKRRTTTDDEGSELEVWRRDDFGPLLVRFVRAPLLDEGTRMGSKGIDDYCGQTWVSNGPKRSTKTLCYACAKMVRLFGVCAMQESGF